MAYDPHVTLNEIGNTYCTRGNRFVVSLIVGYGGTDNAIDGITTAEDAAAAALDLTREQGSEDTHWYVYDRETGTMHFFEQDQFANRCESDTAGWRPA